MLYLKTKAYAEMTPLKVRRGSLSTQKDIKRAAQTLKNLMFKRKLVVNLELIIMTMIAVTGCHTLLTLVPYTLLLCMLLLIRAISGSERRSSLVSSYFSLILIAALLTDLIATYIF
jgi:hypothetical protein